MLEFDNPMQTTLLKSNDGSLRYPFARNDVLCNLGLCDKFLYRLGSTLN